jgi:N-acyl-phosphatidylethanolamine-hydrolysing phospholipase D
VYKSRFRFGFDLTGRAQIANTELLDGLHASPAHAVRLHKDVRARHSLGMHFATFAGSDVEALEPLLELDEARTAQSIGDWTEEGGFGVVNIGETAVIPLQGVAPKATE